MTAASEKYPDTDPPIIDKWTLRKKVIYMDLTDEEEAILMAKAAQYGLTVEEYVRTCLGCPP